MSLTSRRTEMARKRYKPEEIVAKLRQVDVLVSQGQNLVDAIRQIGVRPNSGRNGAKWSIWVVHISAGGAASRWAVRCNVPAGSVSPRMTVRRGPVKLPSGVGQRSSVPAANRPRFRLPSTLALCARSARSGSDEKTGNGCGDWATVRSGSHAKLGS